MTIRSFEVDDLSNFEVLRATLDADGVFVVRGVLEQRRVKELASDLYTAYSSIADLVGRDSLVRAGESGVARAPMVYSKAFLSLATANTLLPFIESVVGSASILHLQNGFVLRPKEAQDVDSTRVFQGTWHKDFPRHTGRVPITINAFFALSEFSEESGATQFLLGSHLSDEPLEKHLENREVASAIGGPGDVVIFDSTIWHRAGENQSRADRLAVNHQYTGSWIKQQMQLWSFFSEDELTKMSERAQQLLGYFTRVPSSYSEFYRPSDARLYRSGQG